MPGAETIDLQEGNSTGVLLLHGFGDTPQTVDLLARRIHGERIDVRAPLLPGHGTRVAEFLASRRNQWLECARDELAQLRASHESVAIAGLSMGGALATILAAETPTATSLVLLAPFLDMPMTHKLASALYWIPGRSNRPRASVSPRSILDPAERKKSLGYGVYSLRLLYELGRISSQARDLLGKVVVPTLMVQSRTDPRIAPHVAERSFAALGAREKKLVWVEGGHVITVDYGRERVFSEVLEWILRHQPREDRGPAG